MIRGAATAVDRFELVDILVTNASGPLAGKLLDLTATGDVFR